jgi:acetyl-CoA acyltransferase
MATKTNKSSARRAVIIGGLRTPFARAFTDLTELASYQLGSVTVSNLLERFPVKKDEIDSLIWGACIVGGSTANVGREIVLELDLPPTLEAYTVSRACTSGILSITLAAAAIERGEADIIVAGGSDSTSNAEVTMPQSFVHKAAPVVMSKKSTYKDYIKLLGKLNFREDLIPRQPSIKERSTGELMGESCQKMAEMNEISREAQDIFTVQSHQRAAKAVKSGRFDSEIVPVKLPNGNVLEADNIIRENISLDRISKLGPVFSENGTLTAANSTPLTDGASAVLIMSEEKAAQYGFKPLAAFRSWSYDAVDPADQLLIGPAISMPRALGRAGMTMKDIDLIDIHEAFAAQVLSVIKMLESAKFSKEKLGLKKAFGKIDPEAINILGGSLAFGHPFGATGARIVTTMANELATTKNKTALIGICAQGGQSTGAVLEAV